ncbi:hypothetical protein Tco_0478225 [Tanacetum coccineum]
MSTYLENMARYKHTQLKNKSFDNIQKLFDKAMKRITTFVDMDTELVEGSAVRVEGSSKRAGEDLQQESTKKQKMDDVEETAEVDEDKEIVELQRKISCFQIIRVYGSSKRYSAFIQMLRSFDREDLETLWKLVKAKHGSIRPEEGYERVLCGDLKTMFEHHVEDIGRIVGIKRLHDDLEVTAAKVRVTATKQNLVLFSNLNEKYAKYTGKLLEEIHVTCAHLEKKQTRLQLYTKVDEENAHSGWRRHHNYW